jgi:hypothetical protein
MASNNRFVNIEGIRQCVKPVAAPLHFKSAQVNLLLSAVSTHRGYNTFFPALGRGSCTNTPISSSFTSSSSRNSLLLSGLIKAVATSSIPQMKSPLANPSSSSS